MDVYGGVMKRIGLVIIGLLLTGHSAMAQLSGTVPGPIGSCVPGGQGPIENCFGSSAPPPATGALLLVNAIDNLLLVNGTDNVCLTGSTSC